LRASIGLCRTDTSETLTSSVRTASPKNTHCIMDVTRVTRPFGRSMNTCVGTISIVGTSCVYIVEVRIVVFGALALKPKQVLLTQRIKAGPAMSLVNFARSYKCTHLRMSLTSTPHKSGSSPKVVPQLSRTGMSASLRHGRHPHENIRVCSSQCNQSMP
jgi:hypothetical protein